DDRDRAATPPAPQNGAASRRAVDVVRRRIPQDGAFACLACRARRDSSRADFCYLDRSPNNMPVRIVDYVSARSATWLARPDGFEPPTPQIRSLMLKSRGSGTILIVFAALAPACPRPRVWPAQASVH